jgi:hypothetical protein
VLFEDDSMYRKTTIAEKDIEKHFKEVRETRSPARLEDESNIYKNCSLMIRNFIGEDTDSYTSTFLSPNQSTIAIDKK